MDWNGRCPSLGVRLIDRAVPRTHEALGLILQHWVGEGWEENKLIILKPEANGFGLMMQFRSINNTGRNFQL